MTAFTTPQPVIDPTATPPGGILADLLTQLEPWPELRIQTLAYHLRQSDATARDGYWHAAVHEARSFLELLVQNMAGVIKGRLPDHFAAAGDSNTRFKICRHYLLKPGYIDPDDNMLLLNVFRIAGAKGSHPGIPDEPWCRLARQFVRLTAEYLIGRYATWRSVSFKPNPTAETPAA